MRFPMAVVLVLASCGGRPPLGTIHAPGVPYGDALLAVSGKTFGAPADTAACTLDDDACIARYSAACEGGDATACARWVALLDFRSEVDRRPWALLGVACAHGRSPWACREGVPLMWERIHWLEAGDARDAEDHREMALYMAEVVCGEMRDAESCYAIGERDRACELGHSAACEEVAAFAAEGAARREACAAEHGPYCDQFGNYYMPSNSGYTPTTPTPDEPPPDDTESTGFTRQRCEGLIEELCEWTSDEAIARQLIEKDGRSVFFLECLEIHEEGGLIEHCMAIRCPEQFDYCIHSTANKTVSKWASCDEEASAC